MKKVVFFALSLMWMSASFAQSHSHHHKHHHTHHSTKKDYYQKGERMFGLNKLSIGSTISSPAGEPLVSSFGIGIQSGRFIKDGLLLGVRLDYQQTLSPAAVVPAIENRFYEGQLFLRKYGNTHRRLSLFNEIGVGINAQSSSLSGGPIESAGWQDAFAEGQVGIAWRLGRRLSIEASGGVRAGTDNRLSTPTAPQYQLGWTYDFGLNWFFR